MKKVKKPVKKIVVLLLALTLVISSLSMAGCARMKKGPITLNVYSQLANSNGEQVGWFAKIMLDKFNVKLNIINDAAGRYVTRMESGDLGDIIVFGNSSTNYIEAVNKGMLYDWNADDLLTDFGPYIKEEMGMALGKNMKMNSDGKLYGIGSDVAISLTDHASTIYHPDVRYDLYKQLDYPKVTTLEDWVDILAQMKEICPASDTGRETYGVSLFSGWDGAMVMYVKSTAALYGWDEFGNGLYNAEQQTWQDCLADGSIYLRCLKFYNDLYQKGLVNPDSMTQNGDTGDPYADGAAFFNIFNFEGLMQYNTDAHLNGGKAMFPVIMEDQKTMMYGLNPFGNTAVITIGAKTQYPELCMEIINWLATPDGKMTTSYGPQGLTWDYDKNGKTYLTELGLLTKTDPKTKLTGEYEGEYASGVSAINFSPVSGDCVNTDSNGETYNNTSWASYNDTLHYDILDDWREFSGFTTFDEYLSAKPHVIAVGTDFVMAERDDNLELEYQQVTNAIKDYSWKAIFAANDAEYDQIVQTMIDETKSYGYDNVCTFYIAEAAKRKAAEDTVKNQQ